MDMHVDMSAEVFATKQDAAEDAALYYGADCPEVKISGCDARGWTYEYVPAGGNDSEAAEESEDLTVAHTDAGSTGVSALIEPATAPEGWSVVDTSTEDQASAVTGEPASEPSGELVSAPRMMLICVALPMPQGMAEATLAKLNKSKGMFTFEMRDSATFEVVPVTEPEGKARKATSGVSGPVCKVDGLTWSTEHCPGEGNRKACESMKRRVDELAAKRDLAGLRALSWAGCPGHASSGNTYQKQGAQYLANWIAECERLEELDYKAICGDKA